MYQVGSDLQVSAVGTPGFYHGNPGFLTRFSSHWRLLFLLLCERPATTILARESYIHDARNGEVLDGIPGILKSIRNCPTELPTDNIFIPATEPSLSQEF
jgi:hypothetical protein